MPATVGTCEHTADPVKPDSAMRHFRAHALLWTTVILALAADLWTKHWAFASLGADESRPGFLGLISYQRSLNEGALFGLGKGLVPLFIAASILAVAFILYFFACSRREQRLLHVALALILAGALGNMFDRTFMRADRVVVRDGESGQVERVLGRIVGDRAGDPIRVGSWPDGSAPRAFDRERLVEPLRSIGIVRDFIKIRPIAGRDVWPWVFNVADSLLVVGVAMLFIGFAIERRTAAKTAPAGVPA